MSTDRVNGEAANIYAVLSSNFKCAQQVVLCRCCGDSRINKQYKTEEIIIIKKKNQNKVANCVGLKQKRMWNNRKKKSAKAHLDASESHNYHVLYNIHSTMYSFIHSFMFGVLAFACINDYHMCASVACKRLREKKKKKRFVVEANKIEWPLRLLLCWCVYMRTKYFMCWCSREVTATMYVWATARTRTHVLIFWRRLHIDWWAFVNLCENRGLTHFPYPCPCWCIYDRYGDRHIILLPYTYIVFVCKFEILQPVEYYRRSNCESNCNFVNECAISMLPYEYVWVRVPPFNAIPRQSMADESKHIAIFLNYPQQIQTRNEIAATFRFLFSILMVHKVCRFMENHRMHIAQPIIRWFKSKQSFLLFFCCIGLSLADQFFFFRCANVSFFILHARYIWITCKYYAEK